MKTFETYISEKLKIDSNTAHKLSVKTAQEFLQLLFRYTNEITKEALDLETTKIVDRYKLPYSTENNLPLRYIWTTTACLSRMEVCVQYEENQEDEVDFDIIPIDTSSQFDKFISNVLGKNMNEGTVTFEILLDFLRDEVK